MYHQKPSYFAKSDGFKRKALTCVGPADQWCAGTVVLVGSLSSETAPFARSKLNSALTYSFFVSSLNTLHKIHRSWQWGRGNQSHSHLVHLHSKSGNLPATIHPKLQALEPSSELLHGQGHAAELKGSILAAKLCKAACAISGACGNVCV